ncbi:type II secretion system minor pseudopilin GspI [Burkholderiaceae bacterium DAT-1]|nr:type II secretion system minor pseudopilin GspI [Burkholderiaceae bacterium DAT-1]
MVSHPPHLNRRDRAGFTLIEVLVALAVIAIALSAAVRATVGTIRGADSLKHHVAAGWVAQNRINFYVASGQFPDLGKHEGDESQAGMSFHWVEDVGGTPNPAFRRLEVKVYADENREHADAILVGYIANVR